MRLSRRLRFSIFLPALAGAAISSPLSAQTEGNAAPADRTPILVGNGIADDTAVLQALLDASPLLELPPGRFRVTAPLTFRSGARISGEGALTVIVAEHDGPVIASRKYLTEPRAELSGFTVIEDLHIHGSDNASSANNHGIVLLDYYSTIRNVEIRNTGGHGLMLAAAPADADAAAPSGTLVENRIENVVVRGSHRTSFFLGSRGNRRLTDGYLYGSVSQSSRPIENHVFLGSAGGWRIRDFHGYGRAPAATGMLIAGGFRTKLDGVHLQNFTDRGIDLVSAQESIFIDALSLDSDTNSEGAIGLRLGRAAGYQPRLIVSGIALTKDSGDEALTSVWAARETTVEINGVSLAGSESGAVLAPAGPGLVTGWSP